MAETPTRAGPTLITAANTPQTIYTAGGAGTWAIVRSIVVTNVGPAVAKVNVGIGTSNADTAGKRIASGVEVQPAQSLEILAYGFLPLAGGASPELLYAVADFANVLNVTLGMITGP